MVLDNHVFRFGSLNFGVTHTRTGMTAVERDRKLYGTRRESNVEDGDIFHSASYE